MHSIGRFVLIAGVLCAAARALPAQERSWVDRWFWGAHAGALLFQTNAILPGQAEEYDLAPMVGGHWLITHRRVGLYLEYEQAFLTDSATAGVVDAVGITHAVSFDDIRRISAALVATPVFGHLQPFVGGGVAIMQVLQPRTDVAAQELADQAASKALLMLLAGFDLRFGRVALFGQYKGTTEARSFLLSGPSHTVQGGIRFALGSSREGLQGVF